MSEDNKIDFVSDSMLLDDIEDMPGFTVLPTGAYLVRFPNGIVAKEINDKKYFELAMTVQDTLDLTEKLKETEQPPKAGDIASLLYDREHKYGMGNFKANIKAIAEKFHCQTVAEVIEASKGLDCMIVVKRTYDEKKDRHNMQIKTLTVL